MHFQNDDIVLNIDEEIIENKKPDVNKNKSWRIPRINFFRNGVDNAHLGKNMEAYYDNNEKKWIFPTDDKTNKKNDAPPSSTTTLPKINYNHKNNKLQNRRQYATLI